MPDKPFRSIAKEQHKIFSEWSSLCLQVIGDRFAVSSFSVVRRLYELKIISYSEYNSIYSRISKEFEENRLAIEIGRSNADNDIRIKYYIPCMKLNAFLDEVLE